MGKIKGNRLGMTLVLAALFVVLTVALGVGLARYADRIPLLAPLVGKPAQTTPVVVEGIQRLNELSTVRWTESVVVTEEAGGNVLPEFLAGEELILVAIGEVEAGVNLDELGQDDVQVEGERVTVEREPAYHYLLKREFEERGTKIRSLNDRGDDSPEGELTDGILDQLAKFERAKTRERTRRGKLRKAQQGKIVAGHRPHYGFKYNATKDNYVINQMRCAQSSASFIWLAWRVEAFEQ